MTRRVVISLTLIASLAIGLVADAGAAKRLHPKPRVKKSAVAEPKITTVAPMTLKVGQKLTITGKNFSAKGTKVYFLRSSGGVVIANADSATKKRLVVTVPAAVAGLLKVQGDELLPTRFKLRIFTKRYGPIGKASQAPIISAAAGTPGPGPGPGPKPCYLGGVNDTDKDGLTDALENGTLKTDPCLADTDLDGLADGFEYQSALDLNNTTPFGVPNAALPYPGKKPWPNPLDAGDKNTDHDGDGLEIWLEYELNKYAQGPKVGDLQYSDGQQRSRHVLAPIAPELDYMDIIHYPAFNDGVLSDDERDADSDGLINWDEHNGRMTQDWWDAKYGGAGLSDKETRYPVTFPGVSAFDEDTDGDGVKDGADDQDHDGLRNAFEVSRTWNWPLIYVSRNHTGEQPPQFFDDYDPPGPLPAGTDPNPWARVQPYNPCKPLWSETCHSYVTFSYYEPDEDWAGADPGDYGPPPLAPWLYDADDYPLGNG